MVGGGVGGGKTASNLRNAAAFLNRSGILVPKYLLCWVWQKGKPERNKRTCWVGRQKRFWNFKRNFRCFLPNFVFISYEAHYYQQRTFSEQCLLQGLCSIDTFGWTFETRDVQALPRDQSRVFRPKDVTLPRSQFCVVYNSGVIISRLCYFSSVCTYTQRNTFRWSRGNYFVEDGWRGHEVTWGFSRFQNNDFISWKIGFISVKTRCPLHNLKNRY